MKQWGGGQAERTLMPWHEGAVSPVPSSCMVLLTGQVSLGQILSKHLWEMQSSVVWQILLPLDFLKPNSVLYLYLSAVLGILSWRKTHQHKTLRFWGHSDLGQYFGLISSSAMERLNTHWQLFLSSSHKCFLLAPSTCRTWGNKN